MSFVLRTERLVLRDWRDEDLALFAALNADEEVMRHFPAVQTRAESDASAERLRKNIAENGFGFWAVEVPGEMPFAGFIGLSVPSFDPPFPHANVGRPCVEIGWRLARTAWGHGYASEGARAALTHGFEVIGLEEIVSFTATANLRSRRVMETIGMMHDANGDFDHSRLPLGHALRRHVLYRKRREESKAR